MTQYTVYTEGGGVGKTTIAVNLAHAHARDGDETLLIDLDQQYGSASRMLDVDQNKKDGEADNLVLHLIDRPKGDFFDLIEETDIGVDVLPSHNQLAELTQLLTKAGEIEEQTNADPNYEYPRYEQLLRVLKENKVHEQYDTIIVDPNAKADDSFRLAVYATRNIVMPVEPSGKGAASVEGLHDEVDSLEEALGVNVGVLAAIPNDINERANDDSYYVDQLQNSEFDAPVTIANRRSLFRGCWREQCSAFEYVEEVRDRERDREVQTLEKFEELVDHIKRVSGASSEQDSPGEEETETEVAEP